MTWPHFADLPRPPLTADEARMIQENITLDQLVMNAMDSEEWDDAADLVERKHHLEIRLNESRTRTWRAWFINEFPGIEERWGTGP